MKRKIAVGSTASLHARLYLCIEACMTSHVRPSYRNSGACFTNCGSSNAVANGKPHECLSLAYTSDEKVGFRGNI